MSAHLRTTGEGIEHIEEHKAGKRHGGVAFRDSVVTELREELHMSKHCLNGQRGVEAAGYYS